MESLLRLRDLKSIIPVSEKTLYKLLAAGRLPHFKVNGRFFFRASEIEVWLAGRKNIPEKS
jgi:predicted DNA-binding transcriptional regulator AlpA